MEEQQATDKVPATEAAQETGASQEAGAKGTTGARRSSRASGAKKATANTGRSTGTKRRATGGRTAGSRGKKAGQEVATGTDHQEVEWQFDADDLERVRGWLGERASGTGPVVGPGSTDDLVDAYYDTGDWRLYRAGYALRVRKAGDGTEATMKSLAASVEGSLKRRREISEPLSDGEVATLKETSGPVGVRLKALVGGREVRKLFEIRTNRQTFALGSGDEGSQNGASGGEEVVEDASGDVRSPSDGGRLGEIVLDSSEIPLGDGGESSRLMRVEVEVGAEAATDPGVRGIVGELEGTSLGLRPARISKFEAGLFATGLSPEVSEDTGPTEVDASGSIGEMAFAVLRRLFATMRSHEAGTRLGEDPEELHDMRVATRRMRAAMRLFEDALPERARWLREELRWVAGALGDVRDLDVQMEQVAGWANEEGPEAFADISSALKERRGAARERMLEALDSDRYARFEASFAEMLRRGPSGADPASANGSSAGGASKSAGTPVLQAAPGLLEGRYRRWRKAAGRLDGDSSPEEYHDLRKKGKRLRYALEFFSGVYGGEAVGALVKPLKAVQDSLGQHQDATVTSDLLREIVGESPKMPPKTAFAMGILAQRRLGEAAGIRGALHQMDEYRLLTRGKAWKNFEGLMEKERRAAEKREKGSGASAKGKKKGK